MTMSNWLSVEKVFHKTHKVFANLDFFFSTKLSSKIKIGCAKKKTVTFCKKKMFHLHAVLLYCNLYFFLPEFGAKNVYL